MPNAHQILSKALSCPFPDEYLIIVILLVSEHPSVPLGIVVVNKGDHVNAGPEADRVQTEAVQVAVAQAREPLSGLKLCHLRKGNQLSF